jgi:glycosyltransferase involved in cell wall biosynthesis
MTTTKPDRIAYVINSLERGGAQSLLVDFIRRVDRSRVQPFVVYLKKKSELSPLFDKMGVPNLHIRVSAKMYTQEVKALAQWFGNHQIDIVHAHTDTASFAARLAGFYYTKAHTIAHYHNSYGRRVNQQYRELETLLGTYTDAYVGCSNTVTDFMIKELKLNRFPLMTIMNGIDLQPFLRGTIDHKKRRVERGIPTDVFHLIHVARLNPVKRPDRVLDVLAEAIRQEKPWMDKFRLTFVGDGEMRQELETTIRLYDEEFRKKALPKLSEKVVFVGTSDIVPQWLAAADAYILLSEMEGMPIAVIEALAAGLPCIVSDIEPMRAVIKHEENGFLVDPDNRELGVQMLERIVLDRQNKLEMHNKAVTSAQKYSLDNYLRETLELYEMVKQKPTRMRKVNFFTRTLLMNKAHQLIKGIVDLHKDQKTEAMEKAIQKFGALQEAEDKIE